VLERPVVATDDVSGPVRPSPPHEAPQGVLQEKRGDMAARAVIDSAAERVVRVFAGALPPPRQAGRQSAPATAAHAASAPIRRTPAESRVADLAAKPVRAHPARDTSALDATA